MGFFMKPYSNDLRQRALKLIEGGMKQIKVAKLFGVTVQTLCKWWKLYKINNISEPIKPVFIRTLKVDRDVLLRFVEQNPNKTLKEIGQEFGCSHNAIFKILKKLNIIYKKTLLVRGETGRFERRISKNIKSNSQRKSHLS